MQRALDFLKNHVEIAFATSEGNRPHIRIFQIMKMEDSTLFFATSPEKEVYRQLLENPLVEMMASEGKEFVKVNGKADFGVDEETQKWIYEHNPILPRLYTSLRQTGLFQGENSGNGSLRPHAHASDVQALQYKGSYGERRVCGRKIFKEEIKEEIKDVDDESKQTPHAES